MKKQMHILYSNQRDVYIQVVDSRHKAPTLDGEGEDEGESERQTVISLWRNTA